jgi:alkylation response protein AidB-like acyl-CoA dehydrogenase
MEPYWYGTLKSPYYKQTHREFRDVVRAFVDKEVRVCACCGGNSAATELPCDVALMPISLSVSLTRLSLSRFLSAQIMPFVHEWDETGTYPPELHEKAYKAGIYGAIWPAEVGCGDGGGGGGAQSRLPKQLCSRSYSLLVSPARTHTTSARFCARDSSVALRRVTLTPFMTSYVL